MQRASFLAGCGALLMLGLVGSVGTVRADAPEPAAARFAAFLQTMYTQELVASPQLATELGSREGDDRWDDVSEAAWTARARQVRGNLAALRSGFVYDALDAGSQLQYRVFVAEQRLLLERYRWRHHLYSLNQIVGLQVDVPSLLTGAQPFESEEDARAYIRRIGAVQPAFEALIVRLQDQARRGIYMPRSVYPLLIEEARNVIAADSPIAADFERRVALLPAEPRVREELTAAARAALRQRLDPAYAKLIRTLGAQAARSPVTGGVWQLPQGDAFYAFLIRQFTTTDMTPEQIHRMGLQEVADSQRQIAALMSRLGAHGTLREFMTQVKNDPRNYESDDDRGRAAYLQRAQGIVVAMQARITDAFDAPAPLPLRIVRTEAYKEASSPPGFYEAGADDGSRPGTVYLNLGNMRILPTYELEDLLYHEGVPGHHLQISTIAVDRSIPRVRKINQWWQDSAFVEGWGLYAERLGKDLGFYQDPLSELGLLTGELWRASRLVVDSGLHYKRWTRAQAIDYLNENTASSPETNERAVDRYLAVPGQATSFMVGMRRFVAERERARAALGTRFDLREYHRVALGSGYVPLWALEQNVSAWIDSKRGTAAADTVAPGDAAFASCAQDYWQDYLALNPTVALSEGDPRARAEFDDSLQDSWRERMLAMLDRHSATCLSIAPAQLSAAARTSLAMLREQIATMRDYYGSALFDTARMLPIDQFQGRHTEFAADAAGAGDYPFKTLEDYELALLRADCFAVWAGDAIGRLRQGMASGVVLPRLVVERILPQLAAHIGLPPERSEFWRPLATLPAEVNAADRRRLERLYRAKIATVIEPAYGALLRFLRDDYLPHARSSVGLGQIPGGAALYAYDARFHTTTTLTPAQIHALGLAEVARIEAELSTVQATLGKSGPLGQFYAQVRVDPAQKFAARADIVPAYEQALQRIRGTLPRLFDVAPQAAFEIRALPESSRLSQGNGTYAPAAADGSRPGILWINTFAAGVQDRFNVITIMLHEGYPGHHFQTSIAQEQPQMPAFRRFDATTAYVEGWALYAESLGKELRLFEDPWDYYGHLGYALLRANRLVIDTGLHDLGWDVAQGVEWMMQHSSMTREQAAAEVERYVAYPGQALAYKVGELKIRELRTRAQRALGPAFDVKAFHAQVLLGGSRPLSILERDIDQWIQQRSGVKR